MQLSPRGRALIQEFEKLRLTAFKPTPNDKWTIGWGHTGPDVYEGLVWTRTQADDAFDLDIGRFTRAVIASTDVPLTQNQFDALVSFAYNEGVTAEGHSTLLRYVNQRKWQLAADEFPKWNKQDGIVLEGLVRRRAEERALFLEGLT